MAASSFARAAVAAALTLGAAAAQAQITAGSRLDFSGTADAIDLGSPGIRLTFQPDLVVARSSSTGTFAGVGGQSGAVRDIVVGNGPVDLPAFLTLGGYTFDVHYLPTGTYGQDSCYVYWLPGQRCTPFQAPLPYPDDLSGIPLSPFNLENHGSDEVGADEVAYSVASFRVVGSVYGPDGARSNFTGTISTTFTGLPFQLALGAVEQTGLQGITFDGRFVAVAVTPEPSAYALMGAGLLGIAGVGARRRRRAVR